MSLFLENSSLAILLADTVPIANDANTAIAETPKYGPLASADFMYALPCPRRAMGNNTDA